MHREDPGLRRHPWTLTATKSEAQLAGHANDPGEGLGRPREAIVHRDRVHRRQRSRRRPRALAEHHASLGWVGASLVLLAGCAAPAQRPEVPVYPAIDVEGPHVSMEPAQGARVLEIPCEEREQDNGVDDNCNGHIDEGHGGREAPLELALSWSGPADVALRTEPALEQAPSGTCTPPRACILRLSSELPPSGTRLSVGVQRAERNAAKGEAAATTASLTVAANGELLGTVNLEVPAGQTRELAVLTVP